MDWPSTISGWTMLLASATVIFGAWTGAALRLGKRYIDQTVGDVVRTSIDAAMQPVQLELVTMNGELSRVRAIETQLENGLMKRTARIENQVDSIVRHLMWDGDTERRNRE